jgi:hypothetical protein
MTRVGSFYRVLNLLTILSSITVGDFAGGGRSLAFVSYNFDRRKAVVYLIPDFGFGFRIAPACRQAGILDFIQIIYFNRGGTL